MSTGTIKSSLGGGQFVSQRFPLYAAKGMTIPSRRRTPTPKTGRGSAAARAARQAATTPIACQVRAGIGAEYTPRVWTQGGCDDASGDDARRAAGGVRPISRGVQAARPEYSRRLLRTRRGRRKPDVRDAARAQGDRRRAAGLLQFVS